MPRNLEKVKALMEHPSFAITSPNCVQALVGGFADSVVNFHSLDGSGYDWFADKVRRQQLRGGILVRANVTGK